MRVVVKSEVKCVYLFLKMYLISLCFIVLILVDFKFWSIKKNVNVIIIMMNVKFIQVILKTPSDSPQKLLKTSWNPLKVL